MDDRERAWLFEEHPPERLRGWAARLGMFRFCRAFGGTDAGGDTLRVAVRVADADAALGLVDALGAVPRPRDGTGVPPKVPGTEATDQPGWCDVDGDPVWLWVGKDRTLEIAVQDPQDVWSVTDTAVQIAERLEGRLAPLGLDLKDPPVDSWHCVAPQTHPELFASPPRT